VPKILEPIGSKFGVSAQPYLVERERAATSGQRIPLNRSVKLAIALFLLASCTPLPEEPLTLPAPLEGEIVEHGHLCDPSALARAVLHKYPNVDQATAQQEADHFISLLGCGPWTPAPPFFAQLAAPKLQSREDEISLHDEIPLHKENHTYSVSVLVNGLIPVPFVLDTGASDVLLPADIVFTLLRTGTLKASDFVGYRTYVLADGRELPSAELKIKELRVGKYIAHDVTAAIGRLGSDPLLGQSFLSRFGSATIDYNRNVLILSR